MAIVGGVVLALIGVLVGLATGAVHRLGTALPANGFGLCTGMPGHRSQGEALTPWLFERLQVLSGRSVSDAPLTFGDLWTGADGAGSQTEPAVDLQMMTTNLTQGRPQRLPWTDRVYFFDPAQMKQWFPDAVVAWMEQHPPPPPSGPVAGWEWNVLRLHAGELRPLPTAENLPVVVATRMSLSFPLLISAVPLWAVDHSRQVNTDASEALAAWRHANEGATPEQAAAAVAAPSFEPNWFSDGGICSNFPVHFFDRALPGRPTFAINLRPFHRDREKSADERLNSFLPTANNVGLLAWWSAFDKRNLGQLTQFGRAIFDTMQNWVDNRQLFLPGYRDRIVHISHDKVEGGMNLTMPDTVLHALTDRGRYAAAKLSAHFAGPTPGMAPGPGWANHRWIRYRTAMAGLEGWVEAWTKRYDEPGTAWHTAYHDMLDPASGFTPPSYAWGSIAQRTLAADESKVLVEQGRRLIAAQDAFGRGSPRPATLLRLVPE
jgi:hypothetical protein